MKPGKEPLLGHPCYRVYYIDPALLLSYR